MITGKYLKQRGWPEGKLTGAAKLAGWALERAGLSTETALERLDAVRDCPEVFTEDPNLGDLARLVIQRRVEQADPIPLRAQPLDYRVWGEEHIERAARAQMERALQLPIAVAGALMPDAHVGYGLPVGGVLATHEAVIPYAVGVDIACRMRLSVYPDPVTSLAHQAVRFSRALQDGTRFGLSGTFGAYDRVTHAVLDDPDWNATRQLRSLRTKAQQQLGSSGTGNHFVEWGELTLYLNDAVPGLASGKYLALLSHSGSRGVGYAIANTYTSVAQSLHPTLDATVRQLAWLPLASEAGQEYWLAMQLAGRFAAANHEVIHQRQAQALGTRAIASIENHHNFAFRETLPDGTEAIVHRKGATPAGAGVLGIIPGTMGDAGYLVRGRGAPEALHSASHGAGRRLSRRQAAESITRSERDRYLRERGVTLIGGGIDEAPQAYKDIQAIIAAQEDLVEVIGKFTPRIVRMADEAGEY